MTNTLSNAQLCVKTFLGEIVRSSDGGKVWVNDLNGSSVGRFCKRAGMDVHTTIAQQLKGLPQCLHCTHQKPTQDDWIEFCDLIERYHNIPVDKSLIRINP